MEQNNDSPGQNKEHNIVVNGRPKTFIGREISFNQVIELAFGAISPGPNTVYTVTYKKGEGNKPEGSMDQDSVVRVKNGTIFNATQTDKS